MACCNGFIGFDVLYVIWFRHFRWIYSAYFCSVYVFLCMYCIFFSWLLGGQLWWACALSGSLVAFFPNKYCCCCSCLSYQPFLTCNWRYYLKSAPHAVGRSTFLCYLIELATGYCWSTVLCFALGLFSATLQSHFMKGFFHRPTSGSLQMLHETWWLIAISRGRNDPAPVKRSTNVWVEQCADLQFCMLQSCQYRYMTFVFLYFINFVVTFYWRTAAML